MNVGLYRSAVAMQTQAQRMDSIAVNLANTGVSGFKRFEQATESFEIQSKHGPLRGQRASTQVDYAQGNMKRTGRDLDLGLSGQGFFAIETPGGEHYTRDGEFHLSPEGNLVTPKGDPVAWDVRNGLIDPVGVSLTVEGDGNVRQGQTPIGRLRIVDFEDRQALRPDGKGLWIAPDNAKEATATAVVNQGALEESNATAVTEMVNMIATQRQFDLLSRTVSAIQELEERLTRSR